MNFTPGRMCGFYYDHFTANAKLFAGFVKVPAGFYPGLMLNMTDFGAAAIADKFE